MPVVDKELKSVNDSNCNMKSTDCQNYDAYLAEERAQIGKHDSENGPKGLHDDGLGHSPLLQTNQ